MVMKKVLFFEVHGCNDYDCDNSQLSSLISCHGQELSWIEMDSSEVVDIIRELRLSAKWQNIRLIEYQENAQRDILKEILDAVVARKEKSKKLAEEKKKKKEANQLSILTLSEAKKKETAKELKLLRELKKKYENE